MLIASFYENAFYKQFALRLRASAIFLGIKCELIKRTQAPGLRNKPRFRSEFLLGRLTEHPEEDVLLVDPDAVISRHPDILLDEQDFDVAVYYDQRTLVMSGPLFVRNNGRVRRMVQEWHMLNGAHPEHSESENLSRVLSQPKPCLDVRRLPVTYAWVERIDRERHPSALPVVTHFKADSVSTRIRILA